MHKTYLFQSARLGFRNWITSDLQPLAALNADPEVMAFFPGTQSKEQSLAFIQRMQQQFTARGFCYFAVDRLDHGEFIGFIGLSEQTYAAPFTPCVDVGWRLHQKAWNQGFATEGAQACLAYAFHTLALPKIVAVVPQVNLKSERVMQKIGMTKAGKFQHPSLKDDERLATCLWYEKLAE